jgi:hypothetical protein
MAIITVHIMQISMSLSGNISEDYKVFGA